MDRQQPFSLKMLRLSMAAIPVGTVIILMGAAIRSPLARIALVLVGGGVLAWVFIYSLLNYLCPHCGARLRVYTATLVDGESVFCPRCGQTIDFE